MNKRLILGLVAVAAIQTAALAGMIRGHWVELNSGDEVVLESTMVDPRDFFRGHYVTLRLNIQQADRNKFTDQDLLEPGKPILVSLRKGDGVYWKVASLTTRAPRSGPFLRSATPFSEYMISDKNKNNTIRLSLPFTRYYAPRKRAQELEKLRDANKMGIVVSVLPDGRGKIKGISMDGELVYDESLF